MISWNRAAREVVRVFSTQNQHIAVIFGKKPRNCAGIELVEIGPNPKVPIFVVQCRCTDISQHRDQHRPDTYCLVEPIAAAAKHPYITIMHRDGSDLVKVESINSHSANTPITRLVEPTTEIKAAEDREVIASAIGFSQNFSLDEAFKDALQKLNARPLSDTNRELSMIDVVSMGAAYGGFSGFNRLFVKIEQSSILHESGIKQGTRKKVHHTHKTVHTTLERSKRNNLHH